MEIDIIEADYEDDQHARDILKMLDIYSRDPMGLNEPLPTYARINVIDELKKMPTAVTFLAYKNGKAVGIANCFISFSTFNAKKLINIHDIAVHPDWRGLGIGGQLLAVVQEKAKSLDCCRITLEVREDNPAISLYESFGFENEDPKLWFMAKEIY